MPEALNLTNDSLQLTFTSKAGLKGILWDKGQIPMPLLGMRVWWRWGKDRGMEWYMHRGLQSIEEVIAQKGLRECFLSFLIFIRIFYFLWGGHYKGRRCIWKDWEWVRSGFMMWNFRIVNKNYGLNKIWTSDNKPQNQKTKTNPIPTLKVVKCTSYSSTQENSLFTAVS